MTLKKIVFALVAVYMCALPVNATCSSVGITDDGTYIVYDCWSKQCRTWTTKSMDLAHRWAGAAYMDNAMC